MTGRRFSGIKTKIFLLLLIFDLIQLGQQTIFDPFVYMFVVPCLINPSEFRA